MISITHRSGLLANKKNFENEISRKHERILGDPKK